MSPEWSAINCIGEMNSKAILVSFEGINAAGKTTQVRRVSATLRQRGYRIKTFRCPELRTRSGSFIEKVLTSKVRLEKSELLGLFAINRVEQLSSIQAAQQTHDFLLFDRYSQSEFAYGRSVGLSMEWLLAMESPMPLADVIIVIDINASVALGRMRDKRDIFENKSALTRLRKQYQELLHNPPYRNQSWLQLDGTEPIAGITTAITKHLISMSHRRT